MANRIYNGYMFNFNAKIIIASTTIYMSAFPNIKSKRLNNHKEYGQEIDIARDKLNSWLKHQPISEKMSKLSIKTFIPLIWHIAGFMTTAQDDENYFKEPIKYRIESMLKFSAKLTIAFLLLWAAAVGILTAIVGTDPVLAAIAFFAGETAVTTVSVIKGMCVLAATSLCISTITGTFYYFDAGLIKSKCKDFSTIRENGASKKEEIQPLLQKSNNIIKQLSHANKEALNSGKIQTEKNNALETVVSLTKKLSDVSFKEVKEITFFSSSPSFFNEKPATEEVEKSQEKSDQSRHSEFKR